MRNISRFSLIVAGAGLVSLVAGCGTTARVAPGGPYHVTAYRPHDPSAVRVKVSLSKQNIYVIEGDRCLMAVACSVGTREKGTPRGHFNIYSKIEHKRSGEYGFSVQGNSVVATTAGHAGGHYVGYPMGYWCEFAPGYGFHQGFVHTTPRTHGCIRLHGEAAPKKVNLRTPDVMAAVQQQVESHYRSDIVEKVRRAGGIISVGDTTVRLAKQFGFCYGVERAIDLAYAARKVFKDRRLFIVGEIIHNPEVNHQIASLGIKNLTGKNKEADISDLGPDDVVIVPAFGTELSIQQQIKDRGCQIVDTTCGDVMSVWKRVRKYASESATSIIHGKAEHEETKATSSRALGEGAGHYLVVLTLADTDYVCDYIRRGGDKQAFLEKFKGAHSPGFDPDVHLKTVVVANQTTMMRD